MRRTKLALIFAPVVFCCAAIPLHPQALNAAFARDPGETIETYGLVFNAILNFEHLGCNAAAQEKR